MCKVCSTHETDMKRILEFWWKTFTEILHLEDLDIDGKTILKWILNHTHETEMKSIIEF
jgi:hypothetical protein